MKVQPVKAQRSQPPVDAYYVTEDNIFWLAENVTKGLIDEEHGLILQGRFGAPRYASKHDVIIVDEKGSMFPMRKDAFEKAYTIINNREG